MYRTFFFVSIFALLINCAASPRYHSTTSVEPEPSKIKTTLRDDIPKNLINAPSLETFFGTASWYGPKFHGRKTANGEVYDMYNNSAAHKLLPFNTWIRVTNLKNNKSIITRINDRGPFIKGRVLDLSYAVAFELGMIIDGISEVKIEVLKWGSSK